MKKAVRLIANLLLPAFLALSVLRAEAASPAEADTGTSVAGEALSGTETEDADSDASAEGEGGQTVITMVGKYDSADTAPVISINESAQSITFKNHDTGRNYTLFYDNATRFTDASGRETAVSSLKAGMLVDVTFLKSTKHLNSLRNARGGDVWSYENQRNYTLPTTLSVAGPMVSSMATLNGSRYLMDVRTLVLVEGQEASPASIVEGDIITATGVGHEVYCVMVTRGHGYLSLSSDTVGDASLVGAWIELDNTVIRKITPNMLMTAPEGEYTMYIIGNGANYSAPVSIARGRETVADTSRIAIEPPKEGRVRFDITPSGAKIRVDGRELSEDEEYVSLEYGIHTLELSADGYETMTRYLRVGSASSVVRLEMTRDGAATETSAAATTSSTASDTATTSSTASTSSTTSSTASTSSTTSSTASTSSTAASSASTTPTGATEAGSGHTSGSGNTADTSGNGHTSGSSHTSDAAHTGSTSDASHTGSTSDGDNPQDQGKTPDQVKIPDRENEQTQGNDRIYVDMPSGAVLYVDGNYIGYIPVSFERTAGIHTITLQQEGRRTISYNIDIEEGSGDKTFTFAPLDLE
ncbi:MAG: PEGA domain-containing protein [Lachnospiraceae bacterium]|nr:PEGA domain-containing protein [Lachnospiraceae bacterium]